MAYGFSSDKTSGNRTFGLNVGRITKIEWTNEPVEALNVEFLIDGDQNPIRYKRFPVNKIFNANGEILPDNPIYEVEKAKAEQEVVSMFTHIFKAFLSEETIKEAFKQPVETFAELCKLFISLLPSGYDKQPIDIFLQYQWQIGDGKEKTYLEIPKNLKHGPFIVAHVTPVGSWKKDETSGLKYIDTEGNIHPFVRKDWFMKSHFANVQTSSFSAPTAPAEDKNPW